MKKSTKILIAGLFLLLAFFVAGGVFHAIGLEFGMKEMFGSACAGVIAALRLVSGT
jgi:hypothetical protein